MLLYKHSARCPAAIQLFLDCNPQYWCFVPMPKTEEEAQNTASFSLHTRRDQEATVWLNSLPPVPSENYTFSVHQRTEQLQIFKDKRDRLTPNFNLDLYNATIFAVCKPCFFLRTNLLY